MPLTWTKSRPTSRARSEKSGGGPSAPPPGACRTTMAATTVSPLESLPTSDPRRLQPLGWRDDCQYCSPPSRQGESDAGGARSEPRALPVTMALADVRVLDLSHALAGPYAST